jgi:hypothetical protein
VASAWIASRLAPHGGRPRQRDTSGQQCYPDGTAVASRRSQRPAGPSYPDRAETERARPRSRSPADFACSPRPRSVRCQPDSRTACILAKLAPGSRMPQDAPGAVGGHGCRRREVTLPCAARKGALPHEGSGWPSSSEMVKLVARLKARLRAGSYSDLLRGVPPSALTMRTAYSPPGPAQPAQGPERSEGGIGMTSRRPKPPPRRREWSGAEP